MVALRTPLLLLLVLGLLCSGCPDQLGFGGRADDDDDASDDDDDSADDDDTSNDDDESNDDDASDDDDTVTTPCDEAISRLTNIGCEFWPVDLDNAENSFDNAAGGQFAVAVANVDDDLTAHVQVLINTSPVGQPQSESIVGDALVGPGDLHIFALPRRDVDGENVTTGVDDGTQTWHSSRAFRVESDAPIVAYQFNTLDQQFSNDASLLLPTHALGTTHHVLSWSPNAPTDFLGGPANRNYVTIVAAEDDTTVEVTPTSDIVNGTGVPEVSPGVGIQAGQTATFQLDRYDVLNLETTLIDILAWPPEPVPDLSGTRVVSTKPVAVFTGNDLTVIRPANPVSEDGCCAEHIEQQVMPTRAMRSKFVVTRSAVRNESNPEVDIYRIISAGGATVNTSLPAPDDTFTLGAGEWYQLESATGFTVEGTGPLHVAQYLVEGTEAGSIGDASLLYVPPVEQRRSTYTLTTGQGFSENWIVVSLVEGASAWIDGAEVGAAIGCTGPATDGMLDGITYESWTCPVSDGSHTVWSASTKAASTEPIAVSVYGYYNAGSYAYAGGAGLE